MICKHCGLSVYWDAGDKLTHASGYWMRGGSRTCTSAVADMHEGDWTDALIARREALRGKVATLKR